MIRALGVTIKTGQRLFYKVGQDVGEGENLLQVHEIKVGPTNEQSRFEVHISVGGMKGVAYYPLRGLLSWDVYEAEVGE